MIDIDSTDQFKEIASDHLQKHLLDESKQAIYKHMMADRLVSTEVNEPMDITIGDWTTTSDEVVNFLQN